MTLQGKTALVTGGSRGIGEAIARRLAAEGANVALTYHSSSAAAEAIIADIGAETALALRCDVAEEEDITQTIAATIERFGSLDILVNNAGITKDTLALRMSAEAFESVLRTNLTGAFLTAKGVLRPMMKNRWGRIINIASVSALLPAANAHTRYSGTLYPGAKSLLIKVSEALGLELKDRNVHVTAVAPGYTWSEFHDVNGARTTVSNLPSFWMLTAEDVAVSGYDAVERGVPLRVPGAWYKFLVALSRVLPDPVGQAIMRMQEKRMVAKAKAKANAAS